MPMYEFDCSQCGTRFEVGLFGKVAAESNARRKEREARRRGP